jgi:hypothetical protein
MEITNSSSTVKFFINFIQLLIVLISYNSFSRVINAALVSPTPTRESIRSAIIRATPAIKTIVAGALFPAIVGYAVRRFEVLADYTGRDGFQGNPRYDLFKMSHYAFHTVIMSGVSHLSWKISSGMADDIKVATLLSSVYFYAVGRCIPMDPAESNLMMRLRYMPAVCISLIAINRTEALRKFLRPAAVLMALGSSFHIIGFH